MNVAVPGVEPDAVALMVKVVAETAVTMAPAGIFVPVIFMPGKNPVVPPALKLRPVPAAVAAVVNRKEVPPAGMDAMLAPSGIPGPRTAIPTASPALLVTVTVVEPLVVAPFAKVMAAGTVRTVVPTVVPPPTLTAGASDNPTSRKGVANDFEVSQL